MEENNINMIQLILSKTTSSLVNFASDVLEFHKKKKLAYTDV